MKKQGFLIALGCTCMIAVSTFVACNEKEENECVNRSLNKKLLEESSDITGTFTLMNGKVEYDLYVLNGRLISSTNVSTGNVYKTKQNKLLFATVSFLKQKQADWQQVQEPAYYKKSTICHV